MTFLKSITQRLFGRTVIDSLDLNQNAWYIDEEQVTVTAAQLNGTSILPATSQTVDVANDDVLFLDHSGSHVAAYDSIADLMNLVAGAVASTALTSSAGVLTVAPADAAITVAADSLVFSTAAGLTKKDAVTDVLTAVVGTETATGLSTASGVISASLGYTAELIDVATDDIVFRDHSDSHKCKTTSVANLATTMAGEGLISASGTINLYDKGQSSHGGVFFTGVGDCTSVDVGGIVYLRDDTPDVTQGEWASGATAAAAATNLAAAINGDTRAALVYTAEAIGDGVVIRAITPGTAGNVAVARVAGAEPSTTQNLVQGRAAKTCQVGTVYHTVTALDALMTEFTLELPFAPDTFIVQVVTSTGVIRTGITDTFNFDSTPLGVVVTSTGITHVVAGDIITVLAISL